MLSIVFAAVLAAAAPEAPAPADPAAAPAPTADPLVCHVAQIPGSRITRKLCMRASEAARRRQDARWLLDRAQSVAATPHMATLVPMGGGPAH